MNELAVNNKIDQVEKLLLSAVQNSHQLQFVEAELKHTFTPGLYSRQITMPAGTVVVSEIHKTEHQYVVLDGVCEVWTEAEGWVLIKAPFSGITKPGTRRVLKIHLPTVWQTFHPTTATTVDEVYDQIIEQRVNPLLKGKLKNNVFISEGQMLEKVTK